MGGKLERLWQQRWWWWWGGGMVVVCMWVWGREGGGGGDERGEERRAGKGGGGVNCMRMVCVLMWGLGCAAPGVDAIELGSDGGDNDLPVFALLVVPCRKGRRLQQQLQSRRSARLCVWGGGGGASVIGGSCLLKVFLMLSLPVTVVLCLSSCLCDVQKGEAVAAAAAEQTQRKAAAETVKERRGVLFYKVTVKVCVCVGGGGRG